MTIREHVQAAFRTLPRLVCLAVLAVALTGVGPFASREANGDSAPPGDRRASAPPGAASRPAGVVPGQVSALVPVPELLSLAGALAADSLFGTVSVLAEEFPTRHTRSSTYEPAAELARQWFTGYGLDQVYLDEFTCCGGLVRHNVVGVKIGTALPDEIVLVGAHLDCTSEQPLVLAPGAEDNASGSAAVLELARVMAPLSTERTIHFVLFGAEEQGLIGSAAYAQRAAAENLNIIAALVLDMVGYYDPADDDLWLEGFLTAPNSMWLVDLVRQHAETYAGLSVYVYPNNGWGSDHQSFHDYGFVSMLSIENEWDSYPCYHRSCDTPSYIDAPFLRRITVANGTATLELAVPAFTLASVSGTADLIDSGDDSGTSITVLGTGYTPAVTNVSGGYLLSDLLPGEYTLRAEHDGYLPDTQEIALASGENLIVDFTLLPETASVARNEPAPGVPPLALGPPAPNPFRSLTEIPYTVAHDGPVWLRIVDARGRVVRELIDGRELAEGEHLLRWDGRDGGGDEVTTGVYWVELRNATASSRVPLVHLR